MTEKPVECGCKIVVEGQRGDGLLVYGLDSSACEVQSLRTQLERRNSTCKQISQDAAIVSVECDRLQAELTAMRKGRFTAELVPVDVVDALRTELSTQKESMIRHFQEEHLAGDGPEIDRWKAQNKSLREQVTALTHGAEMLTAQLEDDRELHRQTIQSYSDALAQLEEKEREIFRMRKVFLKESDCTPCDEGSPEYECPKSERPDCGHHCNHSWSHDSCCWCGWEFVEEDAPQALTTPERKEQG